MERQPPKQRPSVPALPQRSEKRASMILNNIMLDLQNMEGFNSKSASSTKLSQEASFDPHESYLSSEEDASLSDDGEDSLLDFEAESPATENEEQKIHSRTSSRGSQEEARVVSFTMVSKPKIIEIHHMRSISNPTTREHSPSNSSELPSRLSLDISTSTNTTTTPLRRVSNLASVHRLSISSISALSSYSASISASSNTSHPPRKSSKFSSFMSKHSQSSFLGSEYRSPSPSISPASNNTPGYQSRRMSGVGSIERPKTAFAGEKEQKWTLNKGLTKSSVNSTIANAMKKRPSMPKINLAYTPGVVTPRTSNSSKSNLSSNVSTPVETPQTGIRRSSTTPVDKSQISKPLEGSVKYEDIIKNVIRAPPAPSATSPLSALSPKTGFFGLGRRKSLKTR